MPNRDTGHYFLTVLAPIRLGSDASSPRNHSYRQELLEQLARLPNSETAPDPDLEVAPGEPPPPPAGSPFARNRMNHLARFVVIDQPAYNGRDSGDALLSKLGSDGNPLVHQKLDRLATSYLLFAADFDAEDLKLSDAQALRRYTDALWTTMAAELVSIFQYCIGFDGVLAAHQAGRAEEGAAQVYGYIRHCQVETTMPFNDYWLREPGTGKLALPPDLAIPPLDGGELGKAVAAGIGIGLVASLLAFIFMRGPHAWNALLVFGLLLLVVIVYIGFVYLRILARGKQPFPSSATLPEVLKSVYLQQEFTAFAIRHQGGDAAALHAAFGRFLQDHAPSDLADATKTQPPGVFHTQPRELPA